MVRRSDERLAEVTVGLDAGAQVVVPAAVVAEAAARTPSLIFTSDPADISRHLEQSDDVHVIS